MRINHDYVPNTGVLLNYTMFVLFNKTSFTTLTPKNLGKETRMNIIKIPGIFASGITPKDNQLN